MKTLVSALCVTESGHEQRFGLGYQRGVSSSPSPSVPHSPHVSTTVCPAIYAIAIAAIGQVISTAPVAAAAPTPTATPGLQVYEYDIKLATPT